MIYKTHSGSNAVNEKIEFSKKRDMKAILNPKEFKIYKEFKKSIQNGGKI